MMFSRNSELFVKFNRLYHFEMYDSTNQFDLTLLGPPPKKLTTLLSNDKIHLHWFWLIPSTKKRLLFWSHAKPSDSSIHFRFEKTRQRTPLEAIVDITAYSQFLGLQINGSCVSGSEMMTVLPFWWCGYDSKYIYKLTIPMDRIYVDKKEILQ